MQNFIRSPEHTGQNTGAQFANTMSYAARGRGASPAEVNFYVSALQSGPTDRKQVVLNFLRSPESVGRVESSDYVADLKRQPTAQEAATCQTELSNGATFGSVAWEVLGSQEFYDNAGKNL